MHTYLPTTRGIFDHRVWIGTWSLGGEMYGRSDARESLRLLCRAFEAGFFCYDTAGFYAHGFSEVLLRRALGGHRRELLLCTKGGLAWQGRSVVHDASPEALRRQLHESLKRLGTDVIDLYLLHHPSPDTPLATSLCALANLQKEGWIRAYGVCNLDAATVRRELAPGGRIPHQVPFNPLRMASADILAAGRDASRCCNLIISPFEQGLLTESKVAAGAAVLGGRDIRRRNPLFGDAAAIAAAQTWRSLAEDRKRPLSALTLAWLLQREDVDIVIPGPRTVMQLEEWIDLAEHPLARTPCMDFTQFLKTI